MMASSSSSSDLSVDHHLLQDDLPWPSSSSSTLLPPLAPALLHHTIGGHSQHQWSQPLMLEQLSSDELEALLSAQGHLHNHSQQLLAAPLTTIPHHQLSSLLMMQELGFQWSSSCGGGSAVAEPTTAPLQDSVKEEVPRITYDEAMVVDGAVVLPSVDVSRLQAALASSGGGGGEGFGMAAASARLCKSLQAIRSNNGGPAPLVGYSGEHVAYGPPPVHHRLQGPSSILHSYKGPSNAGDQKEEAKVDLRSRGLCLVPLSCTSYVTNENGVWAPPNFRGN